MHIKSIDLENFRRFARFRCEFDPHFTLLVGINGSGKTSLLRAVFAGLRVVLNEVDGIEIGVGDVRRADVLDPGGARWRTPVYPSRVDLALELDGQDVHLVHERDASETSSSESLLSGALGYRSLGDRMKQWLDPNVSGAVPVFARFGASTAMSGESRPGAVQPPFESKDQVWQRASADAIDITLLAQWFQYNELRTLQEGKAPLTYQVAKQAVLAAIHATDIRYIVRDNQLMVQHGDEGWRSFDQLSDGQRRVAAIFCELAQRCAALNSHLAEDCLALSTGVVTIDELDLHLHPLWQRSIIGDLRRVFPNLQFIAASHSPFLLQAAYEHGKVLDVGTGEFVEPTDHSIEDIAESVMGVDQPQRSERFLELKRLAQEFYELLETKVSTDEEALQLKERLDLAMAAFANDPAAAAWLAQRRMAAEH